MRARGCFADERLKERPAKGSQWLAGGAVGPSYKVRYTTRYTVYCKHQGREVHFKLDTFLDMMVPLDTFIAAFDWDTLTETGE